MPLSRAEFAAAFDRVHGVVEELLRRGAIDFHTTYFETVTAMALETFARAAEIAVLEVGLGGRLDATNVVEPELCVITPIDFDHEVYLGRSLEAIAGEKAGILKPGTPAVFARQRPEAERVLEARAAALGIPFTRTAEWKVEDLELDARGSRFRLSGPRSLRIVCPLAGEHQVENAIAAAAALDAMRHSLRRHRGRNRRRALARPPGARARTAGDYSGWCAQSGRRARPGRVHRPFLFRAPGATDFRRYAR